MECVAKPPSGVRKVKKKQVKDELDRIKQAEKKKRRLEKALATSAAIRSELEKKKQMKKEEQQRLDEEGAAIAEAVALQVLLGEDSDESCKIMIDKSEEFNPWDCCASNFDVFLNGGANAILPRHHSLSTSSNEEIVWVPATHYGSRCHWSNDNWTVSSGPTPYFEDEEGVWNSSEISAAGLIAAQAVSSLQIREDECVDAAAFVFNRMVRG